ncbi:hypothetical protein N7540_007104 [Penicillium herquei]|nr:hypothetical protein N7540_007104 [Penicillium herquei]
MVNPDIVYEALNMTIAGLAIFLGAFIAIYMSIYLLVAGWNRWQNYLREKAARVHTQSARDTHTRSTVDEQPVIAIPITLSNMNRDRCSSGSKKHQSPDIELQDLEAHWQATK